MKSSEAHLMKIWLKPVPGITEKKKLKRGSKKYAIVQLLLSRKQYPPHDFE